MNQLNLLTILLAHRLRKSAKELCKRKCRKAQKEEKMILSVILGVAIDTPMWIAELQGKKTEHIVVVDYDYLGEPQQRESILYLSPNDAKNYMKQFDSVEFFTSFYSFPSMRE